MDTAALRRAERAAADGHGVLTRRTARLCGVGESDVTRLVRRGRWQRLHRGVFWTQPVDTPPLLTRLAAARLAAGRDDAPAGVVSGRSAARLWHLDDGRDGGPVELTLPRSARRSQPPDLRYRWQALDPTEVTVRAGFPVTTVLRTLSDLARMTAYPPMLAIADAALREGRTDRAALDALVAALPRRARRAMADADGRAESPFESRVRAELILAGLPPPVPQHVVRDGRGRFLARVDLAWPERRLALEADGAEVHAGPAALRRDLRRQNLLMAAAWVVLRFTWADLGAIAATVAPVLSALPAAS